MSNPLTKYVAAAAVAGAVAFGGLGIASAQEDTTTTEPPATEEVPAPDADVAPDGQRPHREGCDEERSDDATTEPSESTESAFSAT